jgi:hypothetical protein
MDQEKKQIEPAAVREAIDQISYHLNMAENIIKALETHTGAVICDIDPRILLVNGIEIFEAIAENEPAMIDAEGTDVPNYLKKSVTIAGIKVEQLARFKDGVPYFRKVGDYGEV